MSNYCEECGSRVYSLGCVNCNEDLYIQEQEHNNCREDIKRKMSEDDRKRAARSFGPNWANILSGLGDQ